MAKGKHKRKTKNNGPLTVHKAARFLGVGVHDVARLIQYGVIEGERTVRPDGSLRVTVSRSSVAKLQKDGLVGKRLLREFEARSKASELEATRRAVVHVGSRRIFWVCIAGAGVSALVVYLVSLIGG